ncbi:ABC-three component system protein [Rhizobium phaseoli]|uniref:ABC-three component system protein n=1 Tax=Rhizobium phaseoli TaxID=396 RepID=UPI0007F108D9|nr:ABC-three component system protein [Rhizobium phaseoli]ANL39521.1 hypothetical protein AMC88_CH01092 [Rhizobium phaseoli]ANL58510.1 hypothetical protein AMC85_CH01092 [Rhizobium phaseoli]
MAREWRQLLELRLRKSTSTSFQKFFADFMGCLYPDDYIPVRPHGSLGDGGMDGYLRSSDTLYQCYGAENGVVNNIHNVIGKMKDDFDTARTHYGNLKEWRFTHNLIDIPAPIVKQLFALEDEGKKHGIKVGFFGFNNFRELLSQQSADNLEELIGIRALNTAHVEELPILVSGILDGVIQEIYSSGIETKLAALPIKPVPLDKLEYNNIPPIWRENLITWLKHAPTVEYVIENYPTEKAAELAPPYFNRQYKLLKQQHLSPTTILQTLHEQLAGYVSEHNGRYEAALAIMASMFESCMIFEDKEKAKSPEVVNDPA